MADAKLSALTELATTPATDDEIYIRDVSEAMAAESKRITVANLMASTPAVHGIARHTDVTRYKFIDLDGALTDGAGLVLKWEVQSAQFNDALAEKYVRTTFICPDDYVSFVSLKLIWTRATYDATPGNLYWKFFLTGGAASESQAANQESPAYGVTAALANQNYRNVQSPANPLAFTNIAKYDYISIVFKVDTSHVDNTVDDTIYVQGFLLTYTAEQ